MNQSRMTHVTESDEVWVRRSMSRTKYESEKESSVSEERKCTSRDRDAPHQVRWGMSNSCFLQGIAIYPPLCVLYRRGSIPNKV